jgi:thymidylate synthase (FAD)
MIETQPKVRLIAEPRVDTEQMTAYLREVGGEDWLLRVLQQQAIVAQHADVPDSELLVEFCGRLCYKSWKPGLNKNVTKIREDRGEYLLNILTTGHGSVVEHAHFTFVLHDVSRVLTAELNRHRHPNISEQSLRYVRLDELRFRVPTNLKPDTQKYMRELVGTIEQYMAHMIKIEQLDDPDLDFTHKKTITSALRRAVPMGISTEEVWTANLRDIRHVLEMRTAPGAEEEIRNVADQIGNIMAMKAPFMFQDYTWSPNSGDDIPVWNTPNRKV